MQFKTKSVIMLGNSLLLIFNFQYYQIKTEFVIT
jgi:hypothetical protein